MELLRTGTQERARERLFYKVEGGGGTRRSKGERKTTDHVENECQEREKQGGVEDLGCDESCSTEERVSVGERDGLLRLVTRRELMMMMTTT